MTNSAVQIAVSDHRCPTCYVGIGTECVTVYGNQPTRTHRSRILAAEGKGSDRLLAWTRS